MNIVSWARVSSREQKEGYSLDAQARAIRDKAQKEGWKVVKEFSVAESAKRGADRAEFKNMLAWVRQNAKRENIKGLVCHKLDRACRNMRDAVQLQLLEDECGVKPLFVDNQFGQGAAGQFSFNIMASVAQYYSDNLREEVTKGMLEKREQGWLAARAPYGYLNDTPDRNEPIKPDPARVPTVQRIFELYAQANLSFEALADTLLREGYAHYPSNPRFYRTTLSYILNNRFYIGEIVWHGRVFQGKHKPLVGRDTFQVCQDILKGKNRRKGDSNLPLAGGLLRCKYCGQAVTGELIRKRLKDGSVREHVYYRCGNDVQGPEHPTVRWRGDSLETAIAAQLNTLKLPTPEITDWFRAALRAALADEGRFNREKQAALRKRQTELQARRDRLLDVFLSGAIEKDIYESKAAEIRRDLDGVTRQLTEEFTVNTDFVEMAEKVFNLTQKAADTWLGSNRAVRRELLDVLSLNRELTDTKLVVTWNKPFDALAEQPKTENGRGGGI